MHYRFNFLLFSCVAFPIMMHAQVINGYARVNSIAGQTLNLASVSEGGDSFEVGEEVIVMQMQDDVIGANTADNSNFGNLGSIASAGLYEINEIASITESGGVPASVTLVSSLSNTYNTGPNQRVQLITFPTFGSPDHTTTGTYRARNWNGNRGGVLAFNVDGTLTIANDLHADQRGFRGANANGGGSASCSGGANYRLASTGNFADKGEGIYRNNTAAYEAGQARILNGGGGGNSHNGGGGGGGNFTAGGQGGPGWPNCSPSGGGFGGISLSSQISGERIFMGGGGGSGEGNNGGVPDGGDGGGIILISANEIITSGSCGTHTISANGAAPSTGSGGDGNSGGGAGGTIVFNVNSWNIASTCPIVVEANGGAGGDVTHPDIHGAGGGGGMGAIIFNIAEPTTNTTITTVSGSGGQNCNTCGSASGGTGSPGDGVLDNEAGPLPVVLQSFFAHKATNYNLLEWCSSVEINNDYYLLEKSKKGQRWLPFATVNGRGNSLEENCYRYLDQSPYQFETYYRLSQHDFDGKSEILGVRKAATYSEIAEGEILLEPNPCEERFRIRTNANLQYISIIDINGRPVKGVSLSKLNQQYVLANVSNLSSGIYFIRIKESMKRFIKR